MDGINPNDCWGEGAAIPAPPAIYGAEIIGTATVYRAGVGDQERPQEPVAHGVLVDTGQHTPRFCVLWWDRPSGRFILSPMKGPGFQTPLEGI